MVPKEITRLFSELNFAGGHAHALSAASVTCSCLLVERKFYIDQP
jgi:hypothetical protein